MCPDIRWLTGEQMLHCEKDQWVLCEISSTQNRLTGDFCQYILENTRISLQYFLKAEPF